MKTQWILTVVLPGILVLATGAEAQSVPLPAGTYHMNVLSGQAAQAAGDTPVKDDLFAGTEKFAQNASSVTQIDMDPDSLGMVGGSNKAKARHTILSVVHTYSYDKPGMYNMADVDAFRNKLNTGDWHCSVHVREMKSGESTDVCNRRRTDGLRESAIITVEPKSLTFIHTIRRVDPNDQDGPGDAILLPGFGYMPTIAMLDLARLGGFPMVMPDMPQMAIQIDTKAMQEQLKGLKQNKLLDSPEMKLQMDRLQKQLKDLKPPQKPDPLQ